MAVVKSCDFGRSAIEGCAGVGRFLAVRGVGVGGLACEHRRCCQVCNCEKLGYWQSCIHASIYPCLCLSLCPSVCQSFDRCAGLSINRSVDPSTDGPKDRSNERCIHRCAGLFVHLYLPFARSFSLSLSLPPCGVCVRLAVQCVHPAIYAFNILAAYVYTLPSIHGSNCFVCCVISIQAMGRYIAMRFAMAIHCDGGCKQ